MLAATGQKRTTKKNTGRTNTKNSMQKKRKTTAKANTGKKKTTGKSQARQGTGKKSKKEQMDTAMVQEAVLLAVSAVVLVFLLCNFGLCGKFGVMLSSVMFGLFGVTAYLFPVLLFLGVLFWMSNRRSGKAKIKIVAAIIVYLAVCAMLQQISFPYEKDTGLQICYKFSAESHQGGGWIGALIGTIFVPFIGALGMYILMMALILAGLVLITEKSLLGNVKKQGSRMIQVAAENPQRLTQVRRVQREEKQQIRVQTGKKKKKTASAAIFTLDENIVSQEDIMDVNEQADEVWGDGREAMDMEYQQDSMNDRESLDMAYQDSMEDRESLHVLYQGRRNDEESSDMLYQQQIDYMGQQDGVYSEQMRYDDGGYQEGGGSYYEEDVLQSPLEDFARVPKEKTPQDMTVYQNVLEDVEVGMGIPPEMVPFPIARAGYEELTERQQESWNILDSHSLENQEEEDILSEQEAELSKESKDFSKEQIQKEDEQILEIEEIEEGKDGETEGEDCQRADFSEPVIEIVSEEDTVPVIEYEFPSLSLLIKGKQAVSDQKQRQENQVIAQKLEATLRSFGVSVTVTDVTSGPTVTRYELLPGQGVKVSRIVGLSDDIKLSLAAADIRIEAPIPGKSAVGIEVPNKEVATVMLRDLLESESFQTHPSKLAFAVGKDIEGQTIVTDIAKMPHALIAGATGSGKSVCINTLIVSILYKAHPDDVKLIMIDPKVVELSVYNGIPHLLIPVVTDPKKAAGALNWAVAEMTERYNKFSEWNVRNIQGYNEKLELLKEEDVKLQKMPQIVIIIDELADLMMVASNEVEEAICRLAQLARAAGIHLIIATQRPSVNVITGLIKANIPSRIAFAVSSGVDSRTILDTVGAEKLLGRGDMLFAPYGSSSPIRIQGAFVSDSEVSNVVEFLKGQKDFIRQRKSAGQVTSSISLETGNDSTDSERDSYFAEAGRLILQNEKASIGMLQRKFKIGFNRAARIMDQLADAGVVGPEEGTKPRKILISLEEFEEKVKE